MLGDTSKALSDWFVTIRQNIDEIESFSQDIKSGSIKTHDKLIQERDRLIESFNSNLVNIYKGFRTQFILIKLFRITAEGAEQNARESKKLVVEIRKLASEASKGVSNIRDIASAKSSEKADTFFQTRAEEHSKSAKHWFIALVVVIVVLIVSVGYILCDDILDNVPKTRHVSEMLIVIFERLLILTMLGVFIQICLKKYNLERHLEILYKN